jgi:Na+-transporting methylmalonyl-CoA/oxaloacetate decarboxylase gamma subunit
MAVGIGIGFAFIALLLLLIFFRASGFTNRAQDREHRAERHPPEAQQPVVETRRTGPD